MKLLPDGTYHLACGSSEMGNGITTAHKQMAASVVGVRAADIDIINADTDRTPYDTGTFASTGTVVAGKAVMITAEAMKADILDFASRFTKTPIDQCRLDKDAVICGNKRVPLTELHAEGAKVQHRFTVSRKAYLSPRSIAFNVHGFRIAVHRRTGQIVILQSVHAADAGRVLNPLQFRGQIQGSVAQALGWTLFEKMVFDDRGELLNPTFRHYHIPAFADVPRTEVYFADTYDAIGPFGAKSGGESPFNPVAPALANALAAATGFRFTTLPLAPDRIYQAIDLKFADDA
jgi:CO/xanthine dehydrogenase Mo-binding subunit